jgi:hypothetical protein
MNGLHRAIVAGLASGALLGACQQASADTRLTSWENLVTPPPPDPSPLPANFHRPIGSAGTEATYDLNNRSVYASDTYGATDGAKSLKVQINPADTSTNRFTFNLLIALPELGAVGSFLTSSQFAIDVGFRNSDWVHSAGQNGYAGIDHIAINASGPGVGFIEGGRATHDTFREARLAEPDSFKGFWDKSFGDELTTLSWDITQLVNGDAGDNEISAVQSPTGGGFLNVVLSTVYDPAFSFSTAAFYFDNARLIPRVITSEWTGQAPDSDGDASNGNAATNLWHASMNWTQGVPGAADSVAIFGTHGGALSGPQTVNTNQSTPLGGITFDNAAGYTIGGTGSITLDVATGAASINVVTGSHSIGVPVSIADDTTITTAAGTGLAISGNLTGTGKTLTKAGAGSIQLANVRTGGLNISAGSAKISLKATPNSATGTSVIQSLSIATGSSLDLTNNSMVLDYTGPVGTLVADTRANLQSAKLKSSSADASHRIGYGDNALLGKTTFAGQTVDASSILIKFTYGGDANLDGQVDVTDLGALATSWQTSAPWTGGDFNYDGFVDVSDLGILATDWQQGVGNPLGRGSLEAALASVGLGGVSVPEPASLGLLLLSGLMCRTRRRRA